MQAWQTLRNMGQKEARPDIALKGYIGDKLAKLSGVVGKVESKSLREQK